MNREPLFLMKLLLVKYYDQDQEAFDNIKYDLLQKTPRNLNCRQRHQNNKSTVLGSNDRDLQQLLNRINETGEQFRESINKINTKMMIIEDSSSITFTSQSTENSLIGSTNLNTWAQLCMINGTAMQRSKYELAWPKLYIIK